jgi:hypothetical protein
MPDIVDAAQGGVVILLATIVTILVGAVGYLFKRLIEELSGRANRAEALVDGMRHSYDTLAEATDKAADVAQAALDELRRKP